MIYKLINVRKKRVEIVRPDDVVFDIAADLTAQRYELPTGVRYHLQWDVILKNSDGLTVLYESKGGDWRVAVTY